VNATQTAAATGTTANESNYRNGYDLHLVGELDDYEAEEYGPVDVMEMGEGERKALNQIFFDWLYS
jgi:hypothetical protein